MLKRLCPMLVVYHYHIIVPNKMVLISNIHPSKLKKCSEHIFTDRYLYSFLCKRFQIVCQSPSYVVILPNEYLNKDRRLGIDKFLTNLINSLSTIYKKLERAQICCWHGEK